MKALRTILCALLLVALAGCDKSDKSKIQQALDRVLPRSYVGNAEVGHKNGYFDFTVEATGLRHNGTEWTWESIRYRRNGRFSTGWIILGPSK